MCRFLLIKSEENLDLNNYLKKFTLMCKKSRTAEGDKQEDGFGIAWLDKNNNWQTKTSLNAIWNKSIINIPKTKMLIAHARSASFSNQIGKIEYNQPYIYKNYCFVFNGMLRGVKLERKVDGEIGAQKIWTLIQEELKTEENIKVVLENIRDLLYKNSKSIRCLNIGLSDSKNIAALCDYSEDKEYFTLKKYSNKKINIICSEKLDEDNWERFINHEIIRY